MFQDLEIYLNTKIINERSLGQSGDVQHFKLDFEDGISCFVKATIHPTDRHRLEAQGLEQLGKTKLINVPPIIFVSETILAIDYIKSNTRSDNFYFNLGESLAKLHLKETGDIGLSENNFIGHSRQVNIPIKSQNINWADYFIENRLGFQLSMLLAKDELDKELRLLFKNTKAKIFDLIQTDCVPSLLHGDLWAGNVLVGQSGQPILIDPAIYYGHRETDLAMTRLFGGFPSSFYDGYQNIYPLEKNFEIRFDIYNLYHILNHMNIYGSSYRPQAVSTLKKIMSY